MDSHRSVRFKKLITQDYGIFNGKNEITFDDHQTFIVGLSGMGKTTIVRCLKSIKHPKNTVVVETLGDSSLIQKYQHIIFLGCDSGYYRTIYEDLLIAETLGSMKRKAVIDETREIFLKLLIKKPWKKKDLFEQIHVMATGERLCYFYSFAFAVRNVLNLDLPIVFDSPFGLLDSDLREGVESFLRTLKYQQILFIKPAEFSSGVKPHYVLTLRNNFIKVLKV